MKTNKYLDDVLGEELNSPEHTEKEFTEKNRAQKTENLEKALKIYREIVFAKEGELFGNILNYINSLETIILTPKEIDLFLNEILKNLKVKNNHYYNKGIYQGNELPSKETGLYLTKLILDSYNNGHNDFTLTTGNNTLNLVCYGLKAKKERPLKITFDGVAGDAFCAFSEYIIAIFNGHTGDKCCYESRNVSATFNEVVGNECGRGTKDFTATFYGKVGNNCGLFSDNMTAIFNSSVGKKCGDLSKNFTFKTRNTELYKRMQKEFFERNVDGRVELIR